MKTRRLISLTGLGCVLLLSGTTAPAQSVLPPTAAAPQLPAGSPAATRKDAGKSLLQTAQGANLPLLMRGPVALRPHMIYRVLDANGLLNPQQKEVASSVIQTAAIGVLLEMGKRWTFDYTNSHTYYSNRYLRDAIDHDASLTGSYAYDRWTFSTSERYTSNSPTLVETAHQTPQETFETELNASRKVGQRTRISSSVALMWRFVHDSASDLQWTSSDWRTWFVNESVNYELSSRSELGLGVSAGRDIIQSGPNMSHAEPQVRLSWQPATKFTLSVRAGFEFRKFEGGLGGSVENPLYNASIQYAVLPTTTLVVSGSRAFSASYFANWAIRNQGWSVGLDQRLLQRFFLNISYADQVTSYVPTTTSAFLDRDDNVRMTNARLSTAFLGHGSISLIYQRAFNFSTAPGFSFNSHQFGAEIGYHF